MVGTGNSHVIKFGSDRFGLLLSAGDDLRITIRDVSFLSHVVFEIEQLVFLQRYETFTLGRFF